MPAINVDHEALLLLPEAQRSAGTRLLNDVGVPTNVLALARVLNRLARAADLAPLFWSALSDRATLISSWAEIARGVTNSHDLANHYTAPLSRNDNESNPAQGAMETYPLYAALAAPDHRSDAEHLYCTILAGLVAVALSPSASTPERNAANRVATLARRLFDDATQHGEFIAGKLDTSNLIPPRCTPTQGAATLWLRLEDLRGDSELPPPCREFLVAWSKFLGACGGVGTGFDIAKKRSEPVPSDSNDRGSGVLLALKGLKPTEGDEPSAGIIVMGPDADVGEGVPPEDEAERDAIYAWTARTRSEFVLPGSRDRFVDAELAILLNALNENPTDPGHAIIRTGLICGIRPRAIASALDGIPFQADTIPFRIVCHSGSSCIIRDLHARDLPDSFEPKGAEEEALYLVAGAKLQITSSMIPSPESGSHEGALDASYSKLRKDKRLRLTEGRVARQLVCEFVRKSQDPYLADLVLQPASTSILTGAGYYIGMPATAIEPHLEFVSTHEGSLTPGESVMGSSGIPRMEALKKSLEGLRERAVDALANALDRPAVAAAHNAYVLWVLTLLSITSSHRLVQDPFARKTCLIPGRSLFVFQDKVVNKSRTCRFAVASQATIQQWDYYIQHLRSLADRLHFHGAHDAMRVYALLEPGSEPPAPFLFFLSDDLKVQSITQGLARAQLGNDWPWHDSYHRHLLSWWLRTSGVPPEFIHAHLGHWTAGREPFSKESFLSPEAMVTSLAPHLDALLGSLGVMPLKGLPTAGRYGRSRPDLLEFEPWGPLGPELRTKRREAAAKAQPNVSSIAREALAAAAWSHGIRTLSSSVGTGKDKTGTLVPNGAVEQAREAIVARLGEKPAQVAAALSALRTHCQALRNQGMKIRVPGAPYQPDTACELLSDPTGGLACLGLRIREAVSRWITTHPEELTPDALPALLFLSAVINGGLLDTRKWAAFATAIPKRHHSSGIDWLELNTGSRGGDRFLGDAITRALLRMYEGDSRVPLAKLKSKASQYIRRACFEFLPELDALASKGGEFKISDALDAVSDSLALDLCGVALQHVRGETSARTTSASHFLATLGQKPRQSPPDLERSYTAAPILPPPASEEIIKLRVADLSQALNRADADSASNHGDNDRGRRLKTRIDDLEMDLQACIQQQFQKGSSPALLRLTEYALHLTVDGGIQQDSLRPSTIHKYAGSHVQALVDTFGITDPATLDDFERTNVYGLLLKRLKIVSEDFVDALRYFDWYLCETHDQFPADWRMLAKASVPSGIQPFCDFPTPLELAPLLMPAIDAASVTAVFSPSRPISLMATSGIRSGEAYRLSTTDLLVDESSTLLRIRNKASGETKSAAGVRMAFLVPGFSPCSAELPPAAVGQRTDTPLFSGSDARIPRHRFDYELKRALVNATGDARVRPHLMRHGVCSHLFILAGTASSSLGSTWLAANDITTRADELRTLLTGRTHPTSLWSDAICKMVGHADLSTSLEYYGHTLDILVAGQLDRWAIQTPRTFQSAALGLSVNTLNQRVFRRRAAALPVEFPWLLADAVGATIPACVAADQAIERKSPNLESSNPLAVTTLQLIDIGTAMELVYQGASLEEMERLLNLESADVEALVKAIDEIGLLLAPPVPWLETSRIEPGSLSKHLRKACLQLEDLLSTQFGEDASQLNKADVFLASWRPSQRRFVVPNASIRETVMAWLGNAGLPLATSTQDDRVIRFEKADTRTGSRLSNLLTLAYAIAVRNRFQMS